MDEHAGRERREGAIGDAPLGGRFQLGARLGQGGMAVVYAATDLALGRPVAVKLLRPEIAANDEAAERFRRECELLSALRHPALVAVETYGRLPNGALFLVMEKLEGETLGARMRRGRMETADLSPIVAAVAAGLEAAAARGIVHRDLKPDNVFLPIGGEPAAKLLDFGISKLVGAEKLTRTGQVLGTPRYMAPEQLGAEPDVDVRADVYALGVILYEALAGTPPFTSVHAGELIVDILRGSAVPLRNYRPDLPPRVHAVVERAMARAREARFSSARELGEAWFGAVSPSLRSRVALPVMRTSALGTMGAPPPSLDDAAPLRPGTFSDRDGAPARPAAAFATRPLDVAEPATLAAVPVTPPSVTAAPLPGGRAARSRPASRSAPLAALTSSHAPASLTAGAPGPSSLLSAARPGTARGAIPPSGPPVVEALPIDATHGAEGEAWPSADGAPPRDAWPSDPTAPADGRIPGARRRPSVRVVMSAAAVALCLVAAGAATFWVLSRPARGPERPPPVLAPAVRKQRAGVTSTRDVSTVSTSGAPGAGTSPTNTPSAARAGAASADSNEASTTPASATSASTASASTASARTASASGGERAVTTRVAPSRPGGRRARTPRPASAATASRAAVDDPGRSVPSRNGSIAGLLAEARAALGRGDASTCLARLDSAPSALPASSFKLRGDCLYRAGRHAEALGAYERFCRLLPDHPAIGEVRARVESSGGSCR